MKRVVSLVLVLLLLFSSVPPDAFVSMSNASAIAEELTMPTSVSEQRVSDNWIYSIMSYGIASIEGYTGDPSSLRIPEYIDGYPVGQIADEAFANQTRLTSITIPTQVFSIGDHAFCNPGRMTVTCYMGSEAYDWANRNGAKVKNLTAMYLNSGIVDLSGVSSKGCRVSGSTLIVNTALSYALDYDDLFFFEATDKYGMNFWGGRVTDIRRSGNTAEISYVTVDKRLLIDKIIASSDMEEIQVEFIPSEMVRDGMDNDVTGDGVSIDWWDLKGTVSNKKSIPLFNKTVHVAKGFDIKLGSTLYYDFSFTYDVEVWAKDIFKGNCHFDITTTIDSHAEVHFSKDVKLGDVIIYGVDGFCLHAPIYLVLGLDGSIDIAIKDVVSVDWSYNSNKNKTIPKPTLTHYTPVKEVIVQAEAKAGLKVAIALEFLDDDALSFSVEGGIKGRGSIALPRNCIDRKIWTYGNVNISIPIFDIHKDFPIKAAEIVILDDHLEFNSSTLRYDTVSPCTRGPKTIKFELNGGEQMNDVFADKKVGWGTSFTITAPTRKGYTFIGWYTDEALSIPWPLAGVVRNDMTLYAAWEKNHVPTTGLRLNAGSATIYTSGSKKTYQLTATAAPEDATDKTVRWSSSNTAIATVSASGVVKAIAPGTVKITATSNDNKTVTASCNVTVRQYVTSIPVTAASSTIIKGKNTNVSATILPANATNKSFVWDTDNANVLIVDANGFVTGVNPGVAHILARATDGSGVVGSVQITVLPIPVDSVSLNTGEIQVYTSGPNRTAQLMATVLPSNAGDPSLTWSSSNNAVACVNSSGLITGVSAGTCTITARSNSNPAAYAVCTVVVKQLITDLTLDSTSVSLNSGDTLQPKLNIFPANATNQNVKWFTSDPNVATVNTDGIVTAVGGGSALIFVAAEDASACITQYVITVDGSPVTVTPDPAVNVSAVSFPITKGRIFTAGTNSTLQLAAVVAPSNAGDRSVTWSSSAPAIASVDQTGKITGLKAGSAVITATSNMNPSQKAQFTVDVIQRVSSITLGGTSKTILKGDSLQLSATVSPQNAEDKRIKWTTSDDSIATVDQTGKVTGVGLGNVTITAHAIDGSDVTAAHTLTVLPVPVASVTLDRSTAVIFTSGISQTLALKATVLPVHAEDPSLIWSSSDESIASVDKNGIVTGHSVGTVVITATSNFDNSIKAQCTFTVKQLVTKITVTAERSLMAPEETLPLTAAILPSNASDPSVTWSVDNDNILEVDANGVILAKAVGTAVITATANDGSGVTGTFTMSVTENPVYGLILSHDSITIDTSGENRSFQLTYDVLPANATNKYVTWSSSDREIAYVDGNGRVTGVSAGTAVITVVSDVNPEACAECTVTVNQKISSLIVLADTNVLTPNETLQLTAVISPYDSTTQQLLWESDNTDVLQVNGNGIVTAIREGTAVITASTTDGSGIKASITLYVGKALSLSSEVEDTEYYLCGDSYNMLGEVYLSTSSIKRLVQLGVSPKWSLTGGGVHTKVIATEMPIYYNIDGSDVAFTGISLATEELLSEGEDTYTLTCSAGAYSESITFTVSCLDDSFAETITAGANDISLTVGETVTIPSVPTSADGGKLPDGLVFSLKGDDLQHAQVSMGESGATLTFDKSSIYTITACYEVANLLYQTNITIRVRNHDGSIDLPVQSVNMSSNAVMLARDETITISATGMYGSEQVDCDFNWSSSNETVATVDQNGCITAKANGTAIIYAHVVEQDEYGWCVVTVSNVLQTVQNDVELDVYLGASENAEIANVVLTNNSSSMLNDLNLTPEWRLVWVSGDSTELAVEELDYSSDASSIVYGSLLRMVRCYHEGDTVYSLECTAGEYSLQIPVTIHVVVPEHPLPAFVQLSTSSYTGNIGEEIWVNLDVLCSPDGSVIPDGADIHLSNSASFVRALKEMEITNEGLRLVFKKSGVYTANIVFEGGNYSYEAPVTISVAGKDGIVATMVDTISIEPDHYFLMSGDSVQLTPEILPADADDKNLIWSSYDETIATVDANGKVTAISPGVTTISATSETSEVRESCMIYIEDNLSMALPAKTINVYLDGTTRTKIDSLFLTHASSLRYKGIVPEWELRRVSGSCLTLHCTETAMTAADGTILPGADIILYALTRTGTVEYDLICRIGEETAVSRLTVNVLERNDNIPDDILLAQTEFTAACNELIIFEPEITCIPQNVQLPTDLRIAFDLDANAAKAINTNDYYVSRNRSTFSFREPGTYYADCIYACGNVSYTIPIIFRIVDENGDAPVFATKLISDPKNLFMEKGDRTRIAAVFSPADTSDQQVTFSSSNIDVVTVSQDGTVTAVSNGYAQVFLSPSDEHVPVAVCNVTVEEGFNIISSGTEAALYLQGTQRNELANFALTDGTLQRLAAQNVTPKWTVSRKSGNAATHGLLTSNNAQQLTLITETLNTAGMDVYTITCTAGEHVWSMDFTLNVIDLGGQYPESVALKTSKVEMQVGQAKTVDLSPVCSPADTALPEELKNKSMYSGLSTFYDALDFDVYDEDGDNVTLAFVQPGTYLLARTWYDLNLKASALCEITVTGSGQNAGSPLLDVSDTECTAYAGGVSFVATTAKINDSFTYEAFGDRLHWELERISGSSVTAALIDNGRSVGLYVANVKSEGTDVWRLTCSIGDFSESVDITIHAIVPRAPLPVSVKLPKDSFEAVTGEWIYVSLGVATEPVGSRLPDTGMDFWKLDLQSEGDEELIETIFTDRGMKVRFNELGSYAGTLLYVSGNAKYELPVYFYIMDEQGESIGYQLKLTGHTLIDKVWSDGLTNISIAEIVLADADNGVDTSASAALVKRYGAEWKLEVLDGAQYAGLNIIETTPGKAKIILTSMNTTGKVDYKVTCTVNDTVYTYQNSFTVVNESTQKPALRMNRSSYSLVMGESVAIDRRIVDASSGLQLASAETDNWKNNAAIAAMGYAYETGNDVWVATFYETGTFNTTVDLTVGNLAYSLPIIFHVLDQSSEGHESRLLVPSMLEIIEDEAFMGLQVNVIDLRGSKVHTIGSKAFANNSQLYRVYLPASVLNMADDIFTDSAHVVIVCDRESYAAKWAADHGHAIEFVD